MMKRLSFRGALEEINASFPNISIPYLTFQQELPMYKDKLYNYAGSRKYTPFYRQKRVISGAILFLIGLVYWLGIFSPSTVKAKPRDTNKSAWNWLSSPTTSASVDWDDRREKVKDAFMLSWDGYEQYAWGMSFWLAAILIT